MLFSSLKYTESVVLYAAPKEQSTGIFPVFAERTVCFDNENVRRISFYAKDDPEPLTSYVISDDIAHLRFELSAYDNPASMVLYVPTAGIIREFHDLLDAERNVYTIDLPIPQEQDRYFYTVVYVADFDTEDDPNAIEIYLLPDDDAIEKMVQELLNAGNEGVTWKEEDLKPLEPASFQAYLFHVVDQYGAPVQEVYVNFCTDTACSLCVSDENGIISFRGQPEAYHVQMLDVPEGYSFDEDFEFYVGPAYGEWMLRIRKN